MTGPLSRLLPLVAAGATALIACAIQEKAPPPASAPGGAGPRVLFTGSDDGYLDACGCDDGLLGGLPRRDTLLKGLGAGEPSVLVVSNGRLIAGHAPIDAMKCQAQLLAMATMHYRAIALTDAELALGRLKLAEMAALLGDDCPFVASNLLDQAVDDAPAPLPWVPAVVRTVAGQPFVVLAAVATSRAPQYLAADPLVRVADPAPALAAEIARHDGAAAKDGAAPKFVVLGQMTIEEAAALARAVPRIDLLIVQGSEHADEPQEKALIVGTTAIVTTGRKGKYVGTYAFGAGASAHGLFRIEAVVDSYEKSAALQDLLVTYYRDRLLDEVPRPIDAYFEQRPTASGAKYYGAEEGSCASCHPKAWATWSKSRHARAWQTLVDQDLPPEPENRKGHQKNAIWDPDCVKCHVTGFGEVSGYAGNEQEKLRADAPLVNVTCEACHGPAGDHAQRAMDGDPAWPGPHLPHLWTPEEAPGNPARALADNAAAEALCMRCHDPDNSPNFLLRDYWRGIVKDEQREPVAHGKE